MIYSKGKKQDVSLQGGVRIEHDNNRIVYTEDGIIRRIDTFLHSEFYDVTGVKRVVMGIQDDGLFGISYFDDLGNEYHRDGVMPDGLGTVTWVVAKEGEDIHDAFT